MYITLYNGIQIDNRRIRHGFRSLTWTIYTGKPIVPGEDVQKNHKYVVIEIEK